MFTSKSRTLSALMSLSALIASTVCLGQQDKSPETQTGQESTSEGELAKKMQNPVADLISVPIQNNFNLAGYYNVVSPEQGPDWQLRFQVALLFPK